MKIANIFLIIASVIITGAANVAFSEGINSENFSPALDNQSGILWETPRVLQKKSLLLGYTFSYTYRPVELGDGDNTRLSISDHLQVNHLGAAYGLLDWLELGLNIPAAFYSAPNANDGYFPLFQKRNRNSFFFSDPSLRAKLSLAPLLESDFFDMAFMFSTSAPFGNKEALLSDDAVRMSIQAPFSFTFADAKANVFVTPGISLWSSDVVLIGSPVANVYKSIYKKNKSLLLALGGRYWLVGDAKNMGIGSLFLDGGFRGDFKDFKPSLNNQGSPIEWSIGSGFMALPGMTLHGAIGTGIGTGVGSPLFRIVAGIRYVITPEPPLVVDNESPATLLSSSSYSAEQFEEIVRQAQSEPVPPKLGEDEAYLRLKAKGNVIDIGKVRFDFNSSDLSGQAKESIMRLSEELNRLNAQSITIEGHTDSIGSYNYNLALSKKRAEGVKKALVRMGQDPDKINTEGFSYKYPITTNATREGRALNRRIEVTIDGESFRSLSPTEQEERQRQEWIAPGGRKPRAN